MRGRLSILVCLVFALAACGGGHSNTTTTTGTSSADAWAGGVCSAVTTYEQSLTAAAAAFTQNPSKAGIHDALSKAKQATNELAKTLKGLGKPNTSAGETARTTVANLSATISAGVDRIEHAASTKQSALQAASTISATLLSMQTSIKQGIDKLKGLNGGELKTAFASAPSCAKLAGAKKG